MNCWITLHNMYVVAFAVSQVGILNLGDLLALGTTCWDSNSAISTALKTKIPLTEPTGEIGILVCGLKHGKIISDISTDNYADDRAFMMLTKYVYGERKSYRSLTYDNVGVFCEIQISRSYDPMTMLSICKTYKGNLIDYVNDTAKLIRVSTRIYGYICNETFTINIGEENVMYDSHNRKYDMDNLIGDYVEKSLMGLVL